MSSPCAGSEINGCHIGKCKFLFGALESEFTQEMLIDIILIGTYVWTREQFTESREELLYAMQSHAVEIVGLHQPHNKPEEVWKSIKCVYTLEVLTAEHLIDSLKSCDEIK